MIWTIGHSTRSADELLALLESAGIRQLVDVRRFPHSRRHPQFNREALAARLDPAGIIYLPLPGLGGRRPPRADSVNRAWRNAGFRGYADYMQTAEFEGSLRSLIEVAGQRPTAIMCAEPVPWRCHRSLVADALTARGIDVEHIVGPGRPEPHALTPWARIEGTSVTYPAAQGRLV